MTMEVIGVSPTSEFLCEDERYSMCTVVFQVRPQLDDARFMEMREQPVEKLGVAPGVAKKKRRPEHPPYARHGPGTRAAIWFATLLGAARQTPYCKLSIRGLLTFLESHQAYVKKQSTPKKRRRFLNYAAEHWDFDEILLLDRYCLLAAAVHAGFTKKEIAKSWGMGHGEVAHAHQWWVHATRKHRWWEASNGWAGILEPPKELT